jgi:ribosome-associated translation inhibitor RaiA
VDVNKKLIAKLYRQANKEKEKQRVYRWRQANPERNKEINRNRKRKTRGIL